MSTTLRVCHHPLWQRTFAKVIFLVLPSPAAVKAFQAFGEGKGLPLGFIQRDAAALLFPLLKDPRVLFECRVTHILVRCLCDVRVFQQYSSNTKSCCISLRPAILVVPASVFIFMPSPEMWLPSGRLIGLQRHFTTLRMVIVGALTFIQVLCNGCIWHEYIRRTCCVFLFLVTNCGCSREMAQRICPNITTYLYSLTIFHKVVKAGITDVFT